MRNLVIRLSRDRGKTILVSSHLLSEVELMANRMLILHKGKKVVEGLVSELLDPSRSVVHVETDNDEAIRTKLLQTKWSRFLQPGGNGIQLAMSKHEVPALVSDLVGMGAGIRRVDPAHSLEDYFLSLTTQPGHVDAAAN